MKIVKRRLMWIIELFVWFLILLLISSGIMFAKYNYKKNFDTYQIFLPDVDGLIVGSPVKFMGIQIGYVNQLNITGEDIYVNFIITDTNLKIPYGSTATVEFSGLGGSKSLELYPPSPATKNSSMFIVPQPPKRIHDSLGLLNDMFDAAMGIAYDVSNFMEKMSVLRKEQEAENKKKAVEKGVKYKKQASVGEVLEKCECWLDKTQKQCDKFHESVKKKSQTKGANKNGNYENGGKNQSADNKNN